MVGTAIDLTGKRFGALVALRREGLSERRYVTWVCRCDCGRECRVDSGRLKDGSVTSCGCNKKGPDVCLFNDGVICETKSPCVKCSWNPAVEERRKENRK